MYSSLNTMYKYITYKQKLVNNLKCSLKFKCFIYLKACKRTVVSQI